MARYKFLEPYEFANGLRIKNRIVMAPMATHANFHDGHVTADEIDYYAPRAGGPGMIITGSIYASELGKNVEGQSSIASDDFLPDLERVAAAIKVHGTKAILQICHSGRNTNSKVLRGAQPVGASAIATEREDAETPRTLDSSELEQVIDDFAQAIRRAIQAGFDGVELHGAHTFLLQQFVSPHSNQRTDQWGGSFANRVKFPLAVIAKAKTIIQGYAQRPFLLGYRLSPEEASTPGIRLKDTLSFVENLKESGLDYLHVSQAHFWQTPTTDLSDNMPVIKQIQEICDSSKISGGRIPLIGVGSITRPQEAEKLMHEGVEFAALGRQLLLEPKWVQKVQADDEAAIRYTISPSDFQDLAITAPMQWELENKYLSAQHFTRVPASYNE